MDGAVLPEHARDRRRAGAARARPTRTWRSSSSSTSCGSPRRWSHAGDDVGMWDEEDGFFYDVLRLPDGSAERLKVRSMVGLLPLCAVTVFDGEIAEEIPGDRARGCAGSSTRGPS